ncbi:hypothetical protein RLOC_00005952 [Lonchura striata]|uniref:Uncharacterized protein n=1 Tax=Lonchura striata TaxID=40157 RepID=A0A218VEZ3_9PASE|nr:hypothetical protein RLOC_00005952 [Lonchura striata domestica]
MLYIGECQKKFQKIGIAPFGPQQKRKCHHTCKECKAKLGSNEREGSSLQQLSARAGECVKVFANSLADCKREEQRACLKPCHWSLYS